MKLLMDTHCWLWSLAEPERLSPLVRQAFSSRHNDVYVSAATGWEIAIKHALGKLELPAPPDEYVTSRLAMQAVKPLPIEMSHALRAGVLPPHHKDPFDRLLVAQAQIDGLLLVTADEQLRSYEVEILWAS
jgi:PIN domain nuclease of toxin-antitoxin system